MLKIDTIENLIGQEKLSWIAITINTLGFLLIVSFLKEFQPNYVTLCIQYGFMLILDSLRTPYIDESKLEALLMAIIGLLNAIGFFTFFAALRRIDLLVVILVFDFKLLISNSLRFQNKISAILFLFGFILNLMSNDRKIALWALVLGQVCHTGAELIQSNKKLHSSNIQLFKGIFLIMMGLINFGFTSDKIENTFGSYVVTLLICVALLLLENAKTFIKCRTEMAESFLIGLQLFALLLSQKFKILATLSTIFYFSGIIMLYIQKE